MRKIVVDEWMSLDGVVQAPGAPGEDTTGGFQHGAGHLRYFDVVMTVTFQLEGQEFTGINGGPEFKFNEAMSLLVNCDSQEEVDELWGKLSAGGEEGPCGWLKDKFGVSWQIIPDCSGRDAARRGCRQGESRDEGMLRMGKIDVGALEDGYGQR